MRGHPDVRLGGVLFEVKLPSEKGPGIEAAVQQVRGYQQEFERRNPDQRARAVGYDGRTLVLLDEGSVEIGRGTAHSQAVRLGRWMTELAGDVLTPDDFVQHLGPESPTAGSIIPVLWSLLQEYRPQIGFVQEVYEVWQALYGVTTNLNDEAQAGLRTAARNQDLTLGNTRREVEDYLFVVETYIALLLRLLVLRVAAERGLGRITSAAEIFERPGTVHQLRDLGRYFPNIEGLFEEDVFLWPLEAAERSGQADSQLGSAVLDLARQVDKVRLAEQPGDFLRLVYQRFLDRAARTALGEFYTKPELVRETLDAVGYTGDYTKTLTDISCGSGTFLVETIYRIVQNNPSVPKGELVRHITSNVRGIDVHPFAVAMARVNYLLAIAPLLPSSQPISIPIYWADSLTRLSSRKEAALGFRPPVTIPIPSLGSFVLPDAEEISWSELLDRVKNTLERFTGPVAQDIAWARFWEDAPQDRYLPHETTIRAFFAQIVDRRNNQRDMRWLPLLRNAFVVEQLRESCDFVVGNPPWVRIHNVTPEIRARVFAEYQVGMDAGWRRGARLGGASRAFARQIDYCCPFVERALEFLKPGGRLGYVITSKVMHALYGNALRKMLLQNTSLLALHDYSLHAVSLFEDATNYPLVLACQAGQPAQDHQVAVKVMGPKGDTLAFETPQRELPLLPSDSESPWALVPPSVLAAFRKMQRDPTTGRQRPLLGETPGMEPRRGILTDLNKVFIVKRVDPVPENPEEVVVYTEGYYDARTPPSERERYRARLEKSLLRPLIRGENIKAWRYQVKDYILWTHDDETGKALPDLPPKAKAYFRQHEAALKRRSDWREGMPIWEVFRVNRNKLGDRVIWQDIGSTLQGVFLPRDVSGNSLLSFHALPAQTAYLVPVQGEGDGEQLAAMLNSLPVRCFLSSFAERARGAYFRYFSWVLGLLPLALSQERSSILAQIGVLSRDLHQSPAKSVSSGLSGSIDHLVAELYGLNDAELAAIESYAEFLRPGSQSAPPRQEEKDAEPSS